MKFNKTALAVAIAGVAAAPLAQADVTLSGQVAIGIHDRNWGPELAMYGDDSTINVGASHTMNSGLTGYANYRLDSNVTGSTPAGDNVYVGIKGGFGDLRIGEVPDATEYGQVAGDIMKDVGGENAGISYTGSFGPVSLGLNWSPEGDDPAGNASTNKVGVGVKFSLGGFAIGAGTSSSDLDASVDTSVGASFSFAGASVGVALKDLDDGSDGSLGVKVGYGIAGFSLGLTYEVDTEGAGEDDTAIRFDAGYGLGGGTSVNFRYQTREDLDVDADGNADDYWRLFLNKTF